MSVPVGIDACGDQLAGFDIGSMTGISFLRLSNLVDVRVTSRGITTPCGGEAVAHRRRIGAEHIRIFADIHLKHTYPVFPEVTLETSARWAAAAGADVIIVTGAETGGETSLEDLRRVKAAVSIPVVAGSGVDARNVQEQYAVCDGAIIGSALKRDKKLSNPIDLQLAEAFVKAAEGHQR